MERVHGTEHRRRLPLHTEHCHGPSKPRRRHMHQRHRLRTRDTEPTRPLPGRNRPTQRAGRDNLHRRHPHNTSRRISTTPSHSRLPDSLNPKAPQYQTPRFLSLSRSRSSASVWRSRKGSIAMDLFLHLFHSTLRRRFPTMMDTCPNCVHRPNQFPRIPEDFSTNLIVQFVQNRWVKSMPPTP